MKQIHASLQAAVEILVTDGPIKKRLAQAFEAHLNELAEIELPANIRETFGNLHCALHQVGPVGYQNRLHASIAKMSAAEASIHALSVLEMFIVIQGRKTRSEPLRAADEKSQSGGLKVTEPLKFADRGAVASPRYLSRNN